MSNTALPRLAPRRASWAFMRPSPAHWIALGFGSGLAPKAPGTVGSLWAWAAYLLLDPFLSPLAWGCIIAVGTLVGLWACTRTAQDLGVPDPGAVVWDEVLAVWLILWLCMPMGLLGQTAAFVLFRLFDALKPGPVGWADRLFKCEAGDPITWRQGLGILIDDFVAAGCTLVLMALWRFGSGFGY